MVQLQTDTKVKQVLPNVNEQTMMTGDQESRLWGPWPLLPISHCFQGPGLCASSPLPGQTAGKAWATWWLTCRTAPYFLKASLVCQGGEQTPSLEPLLPAPIPSPRALICFVPISSLLGPPLLCRAPGLHSPGARVLSLGERKAVGSGMRPTSPAPLHHLDGLLWIWAMGESSRGRTGAQGRTQRSASRQGSPKWNPKSTPKWGENIW